MNEVEWLKERAGSRFTGDKEEELFFSILYNKYWDELTLVERAYNVRFAPKKKLQEWVYTPVGRLSGAHLLSSSLNKVCTKEEMHQFLADI